MAWKFDNNIPIYIQISNIIKLQIVTKQLKSGDKLPTVRDLAETAGVNPNTVQRALSDLETEGFVYSVRTTGRFVTDNVELIQKTRVELAQQELDSFVTNMLDLGFEKIDLVAQLEEFLKGEPYGQTN
ncbi:GntR family transcriptional regulator [Streptococcus sp.]|uniref:GntR family transcriptional regulator n=1 Tax=Streptococcus sp. TaxID=1306 RepID=UPI0035A1ADFD